MANGNQFFFRYGGQWLPWGARPRSTETEGYGGLPITIGDWSAHQPYYTQDGAYLPAAWQPHHSGRMSHPGTPFIPTGSGYPPGAIIPPTAGVPGSTGTGTGTGDGFEYPMPEDVWKTVYGLEPVSSQRDILMQMATPQAYQQALRPYMESVMKGLGRAGLPSSSIADRVISQTLGEQWLRHQEAQRAGWENLARSTAALGTYWYAPYSEMLSRLGA